MHPCARALRAKRTTASRVTPSRGMPICFFLKKKFLISRSSAPLHLLYPPLPDSTHSFAILWQTSTWSSCYNGSQCWAGVPNYRTRTVRCVESLASSGAAFLVDRAVCASVGLEAPGSVQLCEDAANAQCDGLLWQGGNDWSTCSLPCSRGAEGGEVAAVGVSSRPPPMCMRVDPDGRQTTADAMLCMSKLGVCVRARTPMLWLEQRGCL